MNKLDARGLELIDFIVGQKKEKEKTTKNQITNFFFMRKKIIFYQSMNVFQVLI